MKNITFNNGKLTTSVPISSLEVGTVFILKGREDDGPFMMACYPARNHPKNYLINLKTAEIFYQDDFMNEDASCTLSGEINLWEDK